jgi:hypothetical protein
MPTMFRIAILASALATSRAHAVHDLDVSNEEGKCQLATSKAAVKFLKAKTGCVGKCIAGARKVPPTSPEADCYPPYGGATLTCIADPVKGAEAKAIAAIAKACTQIPGGSIDCPECYAARSGPADCSQWGQSLIVDGLNNPSGASLESQIDALGFVFCNDNPNTAAENKCELSLVKALVKFSGCNAKCYQKCNVAAHTGAIPPGSCSPPSPSDGATYACLFDSIKGCDAKAIAACNKACVTPPADAPECYGFTCSSIVALIQTAQDGIVPTIACGSPSGAFVQGAGA